MENKGNYTTDVPEEECDHPDDNAISLENLDYLVSKGYVKPIDDNELVGSSIKSPFESAYQNEIKEKIGKVLSTLTSQEEEVVRYRHNMKDLSIRLSKKDRDNPTFEEIGYEMEVTGCRVRQIYEKAIRKLRHPSRVRNLKGLLD